MNNSVLQITERERTGKKEETLHTIYKTKDNLQQPQWLRKL